MSEFGPQKFSGICPTCGSEEVLWRGMDVPQTSEQDRCECGNLQLPNYKTGGIDFFDSMGKLFEPKTMTEGVKKGGRNAGPTTPPPPAPKAMRAPKNELSKKEKDALARAVSVIYFADSADYKSALFEIVEIIGGKKAKDMLWNDEAKAYKKYCES